MTVGGDWLTLASENARLRKQLMIAEETIFMLEQRLRNALPAPVSTPPEWHLTTPERRLVALLLKRAIASREALLTAWYADDPGRMDRVMPKILDVFICKIRRKLKVFGVKIKPQWGEGYYLESADKAKLLSYLGNEVCQ